MGLGRSRDTLGPHLLAVTMEGPRLWLNCARSSEPEGPATGCPKSKQVALEPEPCACMAAFARRAGSALSSIPCSSRLLSCMRTKTNRVVWSLPALISWSICLSLSCLVSLQNLHQLKQIQTLKQMNAQLQAENRALARVVARLSASMESAQSQEL